MSYANSRYFGDTYYESPVTYVTCYCRHCCKNTTHTRDLSNGAENLIYTCTNCGHESGPGVKCEDSTESEYDESLFQ